MENTHDLPYTPGEIKTKLTVFDKKEEGVQPAGQPAPEAKEIKGVLILPIIEDDVLYKLTKNTRTSAAKFTTDDIFARIHWAAATELNQMYITADLRPIICDPKKMLSQP